MRRVRGGVPARADGPIAPTRRRTQADRPGRATPRRGAARAARRFGPRAAWARAALARARTCHGRWFASGWGVSMSAQTVLPARRARTPQPVVSVSRMCRPKPPSCSGPVPRRVGIRGSVSVTDSRTPRRVRRRTSRTAPSVCRCALVSSSVTTRTATSTRSSSQPQPTRVVRTAFRARPDAPVRRDTRQRTYGPRTRSMTSLSGERAVDALRPGSGFRNRGVPTARKHVTVATADPGRGQGLPARATTAMPSGAGSFVPAEPAHPPWPQSSPVRVNRRPVQSMPTRHRPAMHHCRTWVPGTGSALSFVAHEAACGQMLRTYAVAGIP